MDMCICIISEGTISILRPPVASSVLIVAWRIWQRRKTFSPTEAVWKPPLSIHIGACNGALEIPSMEMVVFVVGPGLRPRAAAGTYPSGRQSRRQAWRAIFDARINGWWQGRSLTWAQPQPAERSPWAPHTPSIPFIKIASYSTPHFPCSSLRLSLLYYAWLFPSPRTQRRFPSKESYY